MKWGIGGLVDRAWRGSMGCITWTFALSSESVLARSVGACAARLASAVAPMASRRAIESVKSDAPNDFERCRRIREMQGWIH